MEKNNSNLQFLLYLVVLQVLVFLVVILDIQYVRQVLVSLYLFFIPGYILLKALGIERSNKTDTILFSLGLSIVFIMLIGLILNSLGFVEQPLSTIPLLIATSFCVPVIGVSSYIYRREEYTLSFPHDVKFSKIIPYVTLPLLSSIGMLLVRVSENNILLILVIIIISVIFALAAFSKIPVSHYPFVLISIAVALLLMTHLTSNYLNGWDVHYEFVVFSATKNTSYWNPLLGLDIPAPNAWMYFYVSNSMLGSTVFPTVFSNLTNIDGILIFNILHTLVFCFVPVVLYRFYQQEWGKKIAFLSVLFFISNVVFFDFRNNSRQMIADFFFVLLLFVFFKKDIRKRSKWLLTIFFGFALLVSYYMLNYLFLFSVLLTWLFVTIFTRIKRRKISSGSIFFLLISTFIWYMYVSGGPFDRMMFSLRANINSVLRDFLSLGTRSGQVIYALDFTASETFLHLIGRISYYASLALILVGFLALIIKRNKERLDKEYLVLTIINMFALSLVIIIPRFAMEVQLSKWYHTATVFLAPLFVVGGITLFRSILRVFPFEKDRKDYYGFALIATILVPFFLFQTGLVYEVMSDPLPSSIALSGYRMDDKTLVSYNLINENDFFGAVWLSKYTSASNRKVYSDSVTLDNVLWITLMDYDMANRVLFNGTLISEGPSYVFLSDYNTKTGLIWNYGVSYLNDTYKISEVPALNTTNDLRGKIYANGASQVLYYNVP